MESFYEHKWDNGCGMSVRVNSRHEFPAHFHACLEIFLLKRGNYAITINGERREMQDGSIAVMDSFVVHSYERLSEVGEDCVLVVPYSYLQRFNFLRQNKKIKNEIFKNEQLCEELLFIVNKYLSPKNSKNVQETCMELLLTMLGENLIYSGERRSSEEDLIRGILSYLKDNFKEDVTREHLAITFGYAPEHISRIFHRYVRKSLCSYLNDMRLDYVERMLEQGDTRKIVDLIFESGFKSQQTYYRCRAKRQEDKMTNG